MGRQRRRRREWRERISQVRWACICVCMYAMKRRKHGERGTHSIRQTLTTPPPTTTTIHHHHPGTTITTTRGYHHLRRPRPTATTITTTTTATAGLSTLTHVDAGSGQPAMVDVGGKVSCRVVLLAVLLLVGGWFTYVTAPPPSVLCRFRRLNA